MIDRHFIRDGHVEFIENQRFGQMPGEFGVPLHHGHRARTEALIGDGELVGNANQEGGNDLQGKRGRMVVVDHDGDVGRQIRQPFA